MMPMGFEYGWSPRLDVVATRDDEPEPARFDLSEFIAATNAMKAAVPALNEEGPQRRLSSRDDPLLVLERQTENRGDRALIVVNTQEGRSGRFSLEGFDFTVEPLEVRVLRTGSAASGQPLVPHPQWRAEARIHIE